MADPADFAHTPPSQKEAYQPLGDSDYPASWQSTKDGPVALPDRPISQGSSNSKRRYGG
jgi:hypothetical protein